LSKFCTAPYQKASEFRAGYKAVTIVISSTPPTGKEYSGKHFQVMPSAGALTFKELDYAWLYALK
jgi:hypothetical protein